MRERELSAGVLPAAVAGDPQARDRLFEIWGPAVLRWCARLGGPKIDEEDAAHDVFEHVFARAHTLRDPRAFPGWLFATTRRVAIDHRRRAWLRRWVPRLVPDVPDPAAERRAESDDLARTVREALDALPTELREVLVLCELEERNGVEAAELLGVPLGTVKSRLRRARDRFEVEARTRGLAPDAASAADEECG
jgi:RNA polymerase sigma-70 factor (ECF subfamily)